MADNSEPVVLRVTLPVDPRHKTASEVATLAWVRRITKIPVPVVIAHDSSRDNILGFEWILMSKLRGKPLADEWPSLSSPAKKQLVRKLAEFSSTLFEHQLRGIGDIYSSESSAPKVGRMVSMHFFWGDRIRQATQRGPFSSSAEWMHARLAFNKHECLSTLAKYSDRGTLSDDEEDEVDDAERTLVVIDRLTPFVDKVFPDCGPEGEPSMIFHDDLSRHNILIEDKKLSGVLDWECVSALPLWRACDYPSFLHNRPRDKKPDPS